MEPVPLHPTNKVQGLSDAELVGEVIGGRRDAFDELIRRHERQAVAVSYRLLGNLQDALEVTQDAYLKAFANIRTIEKPAAFAGWLMRIVSNLSLNYRRSRKIRSPIALDDILTEPSGGQAPERDLENRELGEGLRAALGKLPEKQRVAIVMFAMQGMPQADVAEAMQCSVEAVKWHVFQGRKKLRELLREHLEE